MRPNKLTLPIGLSCASLALLPAIALSQDFFDGGTSNPGDWNDPVNWNNDTLPNGGNVWVGNGAVPTATANITGPLTFPAVNELKVGFGGDNLGPVVGTVNHSAGSLQTGGWSFIGVDGIGSTATGTYNLSGTGALTHVGERFYVGFGGGTGSSIGAMTVADSASATFTAFVVGANDGNFGSVTQTGGTVSYNSWMTVGEGSGATGAYDISGGSLTQNSDFLTVGESSFATGTVTVSGGADVNLNGAGISLGRRNDGTGNLNIIGSTATFDTQNVYVGIDTDSFAGSGTGNISFTADGSGVTPIVAAASVFINDGTGVGTSSLTVDMTGAPQVDTLLIDVAGTQTGTFGNVTIVGGAFTLDYTFGDGNDIGLRFIPEPSTALLGLLGGLFLLRRRR